MPKKASPTKELMVYVSETTEAVRGGEGRQLAKLPLDVLRENVRTFVAEVASLLPEIGDPGDFSLESFDVAAHVSLDGKLGLLGCGVEAGAQGGLTFRFQRNRSRAQADGSVQG